MKKQIEDKISHPYLQRFITTPIVDEDKLLLIISMLDQHGLTKLEMENFVVTTMLIQIALDTHEYVTNSPETIEKESYLKSRQLTVLAGDYYSGLYYKILADTNNLAMIRVLSEGIKEVNENKIFVYQKDIDEMDQLMSRLMKIESALIQKLADYFHENVWKEISSHFLLIKRLTLEKNIFIQNGSSKFFDSLTHIMFPKFNYQDDLSTDQKDDLLMICDRYIQSSVQSFKESMKRMPSLNVSLQRQLESIIKNQHSIAKTFVEEG